MEQSEKMNKMGVMPVNKLLLSMGIPIVLSMVLQAVYNIVDSAFVSNMKTNGEEALNALTLAFPLQMLMVAIGVGTGVGVNALIAKCLGQRDSEKASRAAGNALFMAVIIFAAFLLFGIFGVDKYISSQTSNPLISDMAAGYLRICCCASFGIVLFNVYEKVLQAGGHAVYSTIAQIVGAVTNIILDPILIYGLLGFPEMGVRGAAWATVIGQILSGALALIFHLRVNKNISNKIKYMKPSGKTIRAIYSIGLPAIIAQALMSVMTYGLNIILVGISESAVTAYGLYYKIQQFILFAAFGLRDAITPVVSFNYGMGSKKRISAGIKCGMLYTLVIMLVGLAAIEIFAVPFSNLFGLSGETQTLCVSAMRIISVSFVFAGANIAFQGIFQALGGGIESLVISLCRQLVFIFPFALLFARLAKKSPEYIRTVWTAFPIAEILSAVVAVALFVRIYRKNVRTIC
jgi:putative MATE family efflux protein